MQKPTINLWLTLANTAFSIFVATYLLIEQTNIIKELQITISRIEIVLTRIENNEKDIFDMLRNYRKEENDLSRPSSRN